MCLAVTFLTLNSLAMISENMSGCRRFMVMASAMVARGNPLKAMLYGILFGYCEALTLTWSGLDIYGQITDMLPYVAVLLVLFLSNVRNIRAFGRDDAS